MLMKQKITPKKQHIYLEAAKLFRDKGYPTTSMRDLAQQVGLEPSSLYSHIKSKEEILHAICFDCAHKFISGMDLILAKPGSSADKLTRIIELHISVAFDDPSSITVFNDEWRHLTEPQLSEFLKMRKDYEHKLDAILQRGMETGEFNQGPPKLIRRTFLSALRWVHWHHQHRYERDDIFDTLKTTLLNGLLTR